MEGYGMTETSTTATGMRPGEHRFGSVGRPHPGVEIRIADDGEILLKGANIFRRLLQERRRLVRRRGRRLAAHRRRRAARRGRVPVHHGAQEGHHHHLWRQEPDARQPRERPQADPLHLAGGDARRPPAVPDDADHARRRRDRAVGAGQGDRGHVDRRARRAPGRDRADPGRARPGQREVRAGRSR